MACRACVQYDESLYGKVVNQTLRRTGNVPTNGRLWPTKRTVPDGLGAVMVVTEAIASCSVPDIEPRCACLAAMAIQEVKAI